MADIALTFSGDESQVTSQVEFFGGDAGGFAVDLQSTSPEEMTNVLRVPVTMIGSATKVATSAAVVTSSPMEFLNPTLAPTSTTNSPAPAPTPLPSNPTTAPTSIGGLNIENELMECWDQCEWKNNCPSGFCGSGYCCQTGVLEPYCGAEYGCEGFHCCTNIADDVTSLAPTFSPSTIAPTLVNTTDSMIYEVPGSDTESSGGASGSSRSTAIIPGIVVGVLAAVVVFAIGCYACYVRRRKRARTSSDWEAANSFKREEEAEARKAELRRKLRTINWGKPPPPMGSSSSSNRSSIKRDYATSRQIRKRGMKLEESLSSIPEDSVPSMLENIPPSNIQIRDVSEEAARSDAGMAFI
mmetsp:Transcript_9506/g.17353  ORF Transcript_9506/g.17353 Transcript_9506/m.17353 type:complete len:355 (-) Transcript_9506:156-1220(-)|eukprot:CAMPEP_0197524616 /NCGR_PEP_ID=MMETSP1318-20131121/9235_1 /TAXON_ID=552666 /ORGANISM="Partenskyella glossopodia, Strain RCC365" /LENGTH=354 /DNA_ID=CAMNT_0043077605 /DNA_START=270 /DNA_END=1334 /DNA_ORIENTATION=+